MIVLTIINTRVERGCFQPLYVLTHSFVHQCVEEEDVKVQSERK